MGWGSAYEIFNAAADALIAANASDEIKETTLTKLIAKLPGRRLGQRVGQPPELPGRPAIRPRLRRQRHHVAED